MAAWNDVVVFICIEIKQIPTILFIFLWKSRLVKIIDFVSSI